MGKWNEMMFLASFCMFAWLGKLNSEIFWFACEFFDNLIIVKKINFLKNNNLQ